MRVRVCGGQVWDMTTGASAGVLPGVGRPVSCFALSPDAAVRRATPPPPRLTLRPTGDKVSAPKFVHESATKACMLPVLWAKSMPLHMAIR